MAYGTELFFPLSFELVKSMVDPDISLKELEGFDDWEYPEVIAPSYADALEQAHLALVRKHLAADAEFTDERIVFNTSHSSEPHSLRPFAVRALDREEAECTFGVSLVGRYWPIWLDWKEKHGGSGNIIALDAENLEFIEEARQAIGSVIPSVLEAPICFTLVHY